MAARNSVTVEVLGFEGCPNTPAFRSNVQAAAATLGGVEVVFVDQMALSESDLRRGYPSPTALVDGHDLFGMSPPTSSTMGCRVYEGGVPTAAEVAERIKASMASDQ